MSKDTNFEPVIVAILCNWCTYTAADLAGTARMEVPPNVRVVRVMCSGRVDPTFVLKAFREGADGVFIGGCHPGDCHYISGNYQAYKRKQLIESMLDQFGIEPERYRFEFIAGSEGDKFARVAREVTEAVRKVGPLNLSADKLRELDGMKSTTVVAGGDTDD